MTNLKREQLIELLGTMIKQAFLRSHEYDIFCHAIHIAEPDDSSQRYQLTIDAIEWLKNDFIRAEAKDKALVEKVESLIPDLLGFLSPKNVKDNSN